MRLSSRVYDFYNFLNVTAPLCASHFLVIFFCSLKTLCTLLGICDKRYHSLMLPENAPDKHNWYLMVLGGRSIVSGADGSCERVKIGDVLLLVIAWLQTMLKVCTRRCSCKKELVTTCLFKMPYGLYFVDISLILVTSKIDSSDLG